GEIKIRSRRHFRHSALLVRHGHARVMIDCGADWLDRLKRVGPTAIVITHAHADHAFGLASGAPCPVYATEETWSLLERYPVTDRRTIRPREPFRIGGISFEAFPVDHSLLAPAVGYRVRAGRAAFFYVPDLVSIRDRGEALRGVKLYIGDGATVTRSMVRRRGPALIGHAPIAAQLGWCKEGDVARAIFTHCGSEIVRSDARAINSRVRQLGLAQGMDARVAHDGLTLSVSLSG
ncbi:MAG: MBL fold metallo-hydrolase, partial [Methyloceanibacter sp.]